MTNVHSILEGLFNSFSGQQSPNKIPTSQGAKTIPEIIDHLVWSSYKTNRDAGCSHEGLVRIGIGNETMKDRYELERQASGD